MPIGRQVPTPISHLPSPIPCLSAGRFPLPKIQTFQLLIGRVAKFTTVIKSFKDKYYTINFYLHLNG
jgi:hypothetical protein